MTGQQAPDGTAPDGTAPDATAPDGTAVAGLGWPLEPATSVKLGVVGQLSGLGWPAGTPSGQSTLHTPPKLITASPSSAEEPS